VDPNSLSAGGWLEDTSLVKKYEISEEAYNKRENTYRAFKAKKLAEDPTVNIHLSSDHGNVFDSSMCFDCFDSCSGLTRRIWPSVQPRQEWRHQRHLPNQRYRPIYHDAYMY
jgi:hypothetical protein